MENKRIVIGSFKNSMNDFIGDLKTAFPKEKYLWSYHSFFQMGMSSNPVDVMKKFIEYVLPYKQYILDGDDRFFLENDVGLDEAYKNDSLRLKELWTNPETTPHTKACIIAHLQKIVKICENFK